MPGERPRRSALVAGLALVFALPVGTAGCAGRADPAATVVLPATADTGVVVIAGPTLIAFFPPPTATVLADSAAAERLRIFRAGLDRVRSPFEGAGVRVYEQYTDTLAVRDGGGLQIYVPAAEDEGIGYYLAAPGRPPEILQGLRSDTELRDAVWRYFHAPGPGRQALR